MKKKEINSHSKGVANLKQLDIENVLRDFGKESRIYSHMISIFRSIISSQHDSKARKIYEYYRKLYSSGSPENKDNYENTRGSALYNLAALHTYITLVSKLFAYNTICYYSYGKRLKECLNTKNIGDLIEDLESMEKGTLVNDEPKITNFPGEEAYIYSWFIDHIESSATLKNGIREAIEKVSSYDPLYLIRHRSRVRDVFGELYQDLIDRDIRRSLGEFYTPQWLSDLLASETLQLALMKGLSRGSLSIIDPMCGSGSIILSFIKKISSIGSRLRPDKVEVSGLEVNAASLILARSQYIVSAIDILSKKFTSTGLLEVPVYSCNILELDQCQRNIVRKHRVLATNPPWINWEDLSQELREKYRDLWKRYGLLGSSDTYDAPYSRMGRAKRDLSTLLFYISVDKLLKRGGIAGFIITQSVFKSIASERFRRFQLPDGTPIKAVKVHDFSNINTFKDAFSRASIGLWIKGRKTVYPLKYIVWVKDPKNRVRAIETRAYPISKSTGVWLTIPNDIRILHRKMVGRSDYRAYSGLVTSMNSVYWVSVLEDLGKVVKVINLGAAGKTKVTPTEAYIEKELVYPLVRGRDLFKWGFRHSHHIVVPSRSDGKPISLDEMVLRYPNAYRYFARYMYELSNRGGEPYRSSLASWRKIIDHIEPDRASYIDEAAEKLAVNVGSRREVPFYYIFNTKNIFSRYKVAWRYITKSFYTAVISEIYDPKTSTHKTPVLDCKLMYIPTDRHDEAHYISAFLNSSPVRLLMRLIGVETQMSVHLLSYINLARYNHRDSIHRELSRLSIEAHRCFSSGCSSRDLESIEHDIDLSIIELYGIEPSIIDRVRRYLDILE